MGPFLKGRFYKHSFAVCIKVFTKKEVKMLIKKYGLFFLHRESKLAENLAEFIIVPVRITH